MAARGPRPLPAKIRELRRQAHRAAVPPPEAHPFECDEGPDAIREWLKERHKWHPGSAELLAMFSALESH